MLNPVELFIGLRYLRAKRRTRFVSFITLISLLGISLGVAALIVILSVMNGFEGELRAIGNVLADQAAFLCRVGFDSFEVDSSQSIDVWNKALASMTVAYQRGYDGEQTTRTSKPVSHDKAEAPQA